MARRDQAVPNRAQDRARDRLSAISGQSRNRHARAKTAGIPGVFEALLAEASDEQVPEAHPVRPAKRRRVTGPLVSPGRRLDSSNPPDQSPPKSSPLANRQTVYISTDDAQDDDDEDDDFDDWEEVSLESQPVLTTGPQPALRRSESQDIVGVSVNVGTHASPSSGRQTRRKPITNAERAIRIATHKAHILFLLFHIHVRNAWCKDKRVESNLRSLLSAKIISSMSPDPTWPQLRQSNTFVEGIRMATELWTTKWKYTSRGIEKAHWYDNDRDMTERIDTIQDDMDNVDKADFIKASKQLSGSQDLCNQHFCALLRAVGVDARLVCSLQPLAFAATGARMLTVPKKPQIHLDDDPVQSSPDDTSNNDSSSDAVTMIKQNFGPAKPVRPVRRIGQASFGSPVGVYHEKAVKAKHKQKRVPRLMYPVFWVEAFNPAYDKWIAVDPAATNTVAKSIKLEPPASYDPNQLSYVVAVEEDGTMRDVTYRYAHAYNAKTRRLRVESIEGGEPWWKAALKPFRRSQKLDRDQLEDSELVNKVGREGMPKNIQDFRDHPVYALERHLKRQEVISPRREVGKVTVGKGAVTALEPVYRRRDVQIVRTSDKWYRLGREIKSGEQALKHVPARAKKPNMGDVDSDDEDVTEVAMYGFAQTQPYIPPPVLNGRIPRNAYGNLDIYVPSMVPEGGEHIRHSLAAKAARLLGIDYADAVVGFKFQGRHGTAVVNGAVVARQCTAAVQAVIEGFEYQAQSAEDEIRSLESLRLWKRFLTGLRIAKRIGLHSLQDDEAVSQTTDIQGQLDKAEDDDGQTVGDGGFLRTDASAHTAQPTASRIATPPPAAVRRSCISSPAAMAKSRTPVVHAQKRSLLDVAEHEDGLYHPETQAEVQKRSILRAETGTNDTSSPKWPQSQSILEANEYSPDVYDPNTKADATGSQSEGDREHISDQIPLTTHSADVSRTRRTDEVDQAGLGDFDTGGGFLVDETQHQNNGAAKGTAHGTYGVDMELADAVSAEHDEASNSPSSEAYQDSLPSQDPDDEDIDADPEWLDEALQ